jgi:amino acid adenylation domain-containing protein
MFSFDFINQSAFDHQNAFCIYDNYYSYAQFRQRVFSIAAALKQRGLVKRNIGVYTQNHIDTYASFYAIWLTGNAYVPIHHSYPESRIADIIEQASIQITLGVNNEIVKLSAIEYIDTVSLDNHQKFSSEDFYKHSPDDLMYILFTSGSTGKPKGVQICYRNLNAFMEHAYSLNMALENGDRYLQMFELSFDLSVVSYVLPLQHFGTIYTVSDQNIKYLEIYRLLEEYELNFAIIVPSVLAMLRPYFSDINLPSLKNVALSGEAVPLKLTEEFQQCCPKAQFHNYYGPTECTIFCTSYKIPREEIPSLNGIVSIGQATLNQISKLIREDGTEAGIDEKAELYLGGTQVSSGYVNNEILNQSSFLTVDNVRFYKTGDLVVQKNDGLLYYLGRKDQQVKIQGYRIELMEVEHLCKQALKTEAAVVAVKDNRGFDNLVLFVKSGLNQDITEALSTVLPKYMTPSRIIELDEFPLNDNGKLDRKTLKTSVENELISH